MGACLLYNVAIKKEKGDKKMNIREMMNLISSGKKEVLLVLLRGKSNRIYLMKGGAK